MTDIMLKAYDLLDEIKSDALYIELKSLKQTIETKYPNEILAFNNAKLRMDVINQEGGIYHPDYKDAMKNLGQSKKALHEKVEVARYIELEHAFEQTINGCLKAITGAISNHIQTPDELGLFKKQGGGCGVH